MARNPIHDKPLFEVWGHGTQESAGRWDGIMRKVYEAHGITSQRQLSKATDVSATTLQSCGAWKEPHRMTYRTFIRICEALDVDEGKLIDDYLGYDYDYAKAFEATYESVKSRTAKLAAKFLTLDEATQETVLRMVGALEGSGEASLHGNACELLDEQLKDVIPRCKSWDYIDLS